MARAKTGTGKTIGFLVPTVERLVSETPGPLEKWTASSPIRALIVSHNRDLARQLHSEAEKLLTYHDLGAQVVIGGSNMNGESQRMNSNRCDILVGTPGRLVDHIENNPGFAARLAGVRVFVLDEADQMLDSGFRKALDTIVAQLPAATAGRQTLMFSATMPTSVKEVAGEFMKPGYDFIDTVGEDDIPVHTTVPQVYVVMAEDHMVHATYLILKHQLAANPIAKVMVFFPTAKQTELYAELFGAAQALGPLAPSGRAAGMKVMEMHSRLSQSQRNRVSQEFRDATTGVLLSSDVSARGMDYPGVTCVMQVGLPDSATQYVQRLGRTGRAGANGAGVLIVSPDEERAIIPELKKYGVVVAPASTDSPMTGGIASGSQPESPDITAVIASVATNKDLRHTVEGAYGAWLGFHKTHVKRLKWSKEDLVKHANALFMSFGLPEPPALPAKMLGKMGMRGVAGIRESNAVGGSRRTQRATTRRARHSRYTRRRTRRS